MARPPLSKRWALYSDHIGPEADPYMKRWIFRTPWGTVRIHNIRRSDEGRDFHDHPFSFLSVILKGGYLEHVPGCRCTALTSAPGDTPCRRFGPGQAVRRAGTFLHRLELPQPAWTFVVSTNYFREWGFSTANGWVHYKQYDGEA